MQPPIVGKVVLGWDPAFRTGCKLAVVDATGKVLDTTVIYPTAPTNAEEDQGGRRSTEKTHSEISCFSDFSWEWNGFQRV